MLRARGDIWVLSEHYPSHLRGKTEKQKLFYSLPAGSVLTRQSCDDITTCL